MDAYYNEIDPYAAQWLRNLIAAGLIAKGDVDERSIEDVRPDDLVRYRQCHFFAGIGGWSHALRIAGWPDDKEVWTGSCPCQPFSAAGKGNGFADERHLWPAWFHLIEQCHPERLLGEQVASKDAEAWIDLVQADLEGLDYAFGAVPFPSASVGAPHIRDRLYWMGNANDTRPQRRFGMQKRAIEFATGARSLVGKLADAAMQRRQHEPTFAGSNGAGMESRGPRAELGPDSFNVQRPGPTNGFWRAADWLACQDGKWRPVEPGTFPLAHGISNRVGRLRAYGNAIVPQVAAEFISAYLECQPQ